MSSNRFELKSAAIAFDAAGVFLAGGLSRDEWVALCPKLEAARRLIVERMGPNDEQAIIVATPEKVQAAYKAGRRTSELGRILAAAKHLREAVDAVVIVGSAADCAAAKAVFAACCHRYHNEQSRGDRGGRPTIYFAGEQFDNDHLAGLLDLLPHERPGATVDERWGIIAIDSGCREGAASHKDETTPAAAAFQILLTALRQSCDDELDRSHRLILPVTSADSCLARVCRAIELAERFEITPGVGGAAAVFSPVGLLPASVMGLDIVRLLQGAAAMNERFRAAPIGDNPPLDFAGIVDLVRRGSEIVSCRFVASSRAAAVVAESCARIMDGQTNRRTLTPALSRQGRGSDPELIINLVAESLRRDPIRIAGEGVNDPLHPLAGKSLPELSAAAFKSAKAELRAAGRPSVDIRLPALDEFSLGQLFQMLIIARVLEAKL
ncbi:MAG TPA: hypothetical protein VKB78_04335 [Pirellulales bacterium]|nr:hypothetical protein [Pirellulales bacterium]